MFSCVIMNKFIMAILICFDFGMTKGQISYELLPSSVICFLCANFITYVVPNKQLCFMVLPGGGGGGTCANGVVTV